MTQNTKTLIEVIERSKTNGMLQLEDASIAPGYRQDELEKITAGLGIAFGEELMEFFGTVGKISFDWSPNDSKLSAPPEERQYLGGSIQILNPVEMVMDKSGKRWKDVLWFDHMDEKEKERYRRFIPFDFPSPELVAGFTLEGKRLSRQMFLLNVNEGISPLSINLNEYLGLLIQTRGYVYWQSFFGNRDSSDYTRYLKYMPLLFPGEDHDFINK